MFDADMPAPKYASLQSPDSGLADAEIEDGEFSFPAVAAGRYTLRLAWDEQDIVVEDLAVGGPDVE